MAVKVFWKAANGASKETEHDTANDAVVEDGHLLVRVLDTHGYGTGVAGYAPGVWLSFVQSSPKD